MRAWVTNRQVEPLRSTGMQPLQSASGPSPGGAAVVGPMRLALFGAVVADAMIAVGRGRQLLS